MALSPFDEATQQLFQDPGLPRIKKLLVYTCNRVWESDPHRLSQYNLQDLIASMLAIAPTLEQLTTQLDNAVSTINKPVEYALVAQAIIKHLDPLYRIPTAHSINIDPAQLGAIASQLQAGADPLRTRKLLYAACHHTWENDPTLLMQQNLESLVLSVYQLNPSLEQLQAALHRIVKTLNRQTEYIRIAEAIVQTVAPLYNTPQDSHTQIVITAPIETPQDLTQLVMPALAEPVVGSASASVHQVAYSTTNPDTPSEPAPPGSSLQYSLDNLFDVRLELFKFTNPLRVKALIFSVVHAPLTEDLTIGTLLKEYELDELLRSLFYTYPGFDQLETDLRRIAQRLPNSGHYTQVCGALLRVIKPVYEAGTSGLTLTTAAQQGAPSGLSSSAQTQSGDREDTCQFSSLHLSSFSKSSGSFSGDDPHTSPLVAEPHELTPTINPNPPLA